MTWLFSNTLGIHFKGGIWHTQESVVQVSLLANTAWLNVQHADTLGVRESAGEADMKDDMTKSRTEPRMISGAPQSPQEDYMYSKYARRHLLRILEKEIPCIHVLRALQ